MKNKQILLKAARETQLHLRELPQDSQIFFIYSSLGRPEGSGTTYSKCEREKHNWSEYSNPARLSFRTERKIKSFSDKPHLKEFITMKLALQEMLKKLL